MSERFEVELEDVYFSAYGCGKECYGGIEMYIKDANTGEVLAEVSDEECFMFSDYKQVVWMSELDGTVKDLITQVRGEVELSDDESTELTKEIKVKLKTEITGRAMGEWYSEPDYIQGWDDIEVAA
jgi:hypothetical protein